MFRPIVLFGTLSLAAAQAQATTFKTMQETSPQGARPTATAVAPAGWQVIGGGCEANFGKAGQLLTASYPDSFGWKCSARDHTESDPGTVTATAIIAPSDFYVGRLEETGAKAAHPKAVSPEPWKGYRLIGGGCRVNQNLSGAGSLLTYSGPSASDPNRWECRAKDHLKSDPTTVTAFSIIAPIEAIADVKVVSSSSLVTPHPKQSQGVPRGYHLLGGGCSDAFTGPGNMLVASTPSQDLREWQCKGKDHVQSDPASMTAFAVAVKLGTPEPAPTPVAVPAPPPAAVEPPPAPVVVSSCVSDNDLEAIKGAVQNESFSKDQLNALKMASDGRSFCVAQVGDIVDLFSFSADKIAAVKMLKSQIVDPQHSFKLLERFTFSADKEAVRKLFK